MKKKTTKKKKRTATPPELKRLNDKLDLFGEMFHNMSKDHNHTVGDALAYMQAATMAIINVAEGFAKREKEIGRRALADSIGHLAIHCAGPVDHHH